MLSCSPGPCGMLACLHFRGILCPLRNTPLFNGFICTPVCQLDWGCVKLVRLVVYQASLARHQWKWCSWLFWTLHRTTSSLVILWNHTASLYLHCGSSKGIEGKCAQIIFNFLPRCLLLLLQPAVLMCGFMGHTEPGNYSSTVCSQAKQTPNKLQNWQENQTNKPVCS